MAIPLKYNWRNLCVRKTTTLLTALSIALAAFVCTFLMGVIGGFKSCLHSSGDAQNMIILREGARREVVSSVNRDAVPIIKYLPGIATGRDGNPLVSPEVVALIALRKTNGTRANIIVRGVGQSGISLRPGFRLLQGQMYKSGAREVIVSANMASQLGLSLGQSINFGRGRWAVVGIFQVPNTVYDSEIWADVDAVANDFGRQSYSSVLVRVSDGVSDSALNAQLINDRRLQCKAVNQQEYFDTQNEAARPLQLFAVSIVLIMAIGAAFAAMNTMHTAVFLRTSEIATITSLGFSRTSIIMSFLLESMILAGLGGLLGSIAAVATDVITASTTNFATLSALAFHINVKPLYVAIGVVLAIVIGAVGGLVPAWMATRQTMATALRAN
jgi:putative ABC transport system permease protein